MRSGGGPVAIRFCFDCGPVLVRFWSGCGPIGGFVGSWSYLSQRDQVLRGRWPVSLLARLSARGSFAFAMSNACGLGGTRCKSG